MVQGAARRQLRTVRVDEVVEAVGEPVDGVVVADVDR
jgi:hypothetical protein